MSDFGKRRSYGKKGSQDGGISGSAVPVAQRAEYKPDQAIPGTGPQDDTQAEEIGIAPIFVFS